MSAGDYGNRRPKPGKRASYPVCKTVTLTEGQAMKLAQLANARRTTASAVVRQLLEEANLCLPEG